MIKSQRKIKYNAITTALALSVITTATLLPTIAYADTGVTVSVSGADKLDGYAITGTYYNIGSAEKEQTVLKTDTDGKVYFPLPTKDYTNFDFTMLVKGYEVTGTKSVADIKNETKSVLNTDISWAVELGLINQTETSDGETIYNEIEKDGAVQGTENTSEAYEDKPAIDDKNSDSPPNKDTQATDNMQNKDEATVTVQVESDVSIELLRETGTITLSGLNGSASFTYNLNGINNTATAMLPDGTYSLSSSETSCKVVLPEACTITNGTCTINVKLQSVSTLKILNSTQPFDKCRVRSGNNSLLMYDSECIAVEPKRNYVVNINDEPIKYNLQIPTTPNKYIFDFATGELTIDRPDKSAETVVGTVENPFGIAETTDKGYTKEKTPATWVLTTVTSAISAAVALLCKKRSTKA